MSAAWAEDPKVVPCSESACVQQQVAARGRKAPPLRSSLMHNFLSRLGLRFEDSVDERAFVACFNPRRLLPPACGDAGRLHRWHRRMRPDTRPCKTGPNTRFLRLAIAASVLLPALAGHNLRINPALVRRVQDRRARAAGHPGGRSDPLEVAASRSGGGWLPIATAIDPTPGFHRLKEQHPAPYETFKLRIIS